MGIPSVTYEEARTFLRGLAVGSRVAIAYHGDADGTGSAALAVRYLEQTQRRAVITIAPGKGEDFYSDTFRAKLLSAKPQALLILDQGSRSESLLDGVPTLIVDHHDAPEMPIPGALYLSGLHESPVPPASLMTWRLLSPLANLNPYMWYMAIGTAGDLGTTLPFTEWATAKKIFGLKNISESVALVNAAKRSHAHDTEASLSGLLNAESAADLANGMIEEYDILEEYRNEVQTERARCAKTAPRFAEDWALLRFASPCQLHGPLASSWVGRLPKYIIIAANDGYTPGNVHFSIRAKRDVNLLERLRAFRTTVDAPDLGHGHKEATGGVLPTAQFEKLIAAMGFANAETSVVKE